MAETRPPTLVQSATFRLAAFYSLAFVVAALALGVAGYRAIRAELRYELDQRILAERDALLGESGGRLDRLLAAVVARDRRGGDDMFYVVSGGGNVLAGRSLMRAPRVGWFDARYRDPDGRPDGGRSIGVAIGQGRILVVGADPELIERLDARMVPLFALTFGLMGLLGVGGGFLLSAALRRRLDAITGAAEAIIEGDLSRRMPVGPGGHEFDRLSSTLNRMLDRIAVLMANLRQVSGDIAHDLRTPLTRLRQKIEVAAAPTATVEMLRDALHQAGAHADELLALFAAILAIAEVEAGGGALRLRPIDLSALVADIADSYLPAAEDGGRALDRAVSPGMAIDGVRELIAQLIANLLDNALRHTPEGTRVRVSLEGEGGRAVLTVADDGPGIPSADRDRVFERFVRLEQSRTTPGHGLGLRLVAAIAGAHHAAIVLADNQPGVAMMISFPRRER